MDIYVKYSPAADSRTATGPVSKEDLLASSVYHIGDVQKALTWLASKLVYAGAMHDHTKISGIDDFYDSFSRSIAGSKTFTQEPWYENHISIERHHLNEKCPEDVTLIDVLERAADITTAAAARGGKVYKVYDDTLDPELLLRAYKNTVRLLQEHIIVEK